MLCKEELTAKTHLVVVEREEGRGGVWFPWREAAGSKTR